MQIKTKYVLYTVTMGGAVLLLVQILNSYTFFKSAPKSYILSMGDAVLRLVDIFKSQIDNSTQFTTYTTTTGGAVLRLVILKRQLFTDLMVHILKNQLYARLIWYI